MKFNNPTTTSKIKFGIYFIEEAEVTAVLFATNSVNTEGLDKFQVFIQEFLSYAPGDFYVQQIEKSAEEFPVFLRTEIKLFKKGDNR